MSFWQFSVTASSNQNADPSVLFTEGQAPSTLNDASRALMSSLACWRQDTSGERTTAGGATAFTYTTSSSANLAQTTSATPPTGMRLRFTFNVQPSGTPTLAVDGGTAFPIQLAGATPTSGVLVTNVPYTFEFTGSVWQGCEYYVTPAGPTTPALLNTITASNSASLSDTTSITGSRLRYRIDMANLVPATNNVGLVLQVHASAAFQTANYYATQIEWAGASSTVTSFNNTANSLALTSLASNNLSNSSSLGFSGYVDIYTLSGNDTMLVADATYFASSTQLNQVKGSAFWNSSTSIDGFRILATSGNISAGQIKVWGF